MSVLVVTISAIFPLVRRKLCVSQMDINRWNADEAVSRFARP
jgi:hypothetical protein